MAALVLAAPAAAATITVTSNGDGTTTDTLRAAIQSVNSGSDANADVTAHRTGTYGSNDTIVFGLGSGPQTITLTGGDLTVTTTHSLAINGPGAPALTVTAGGKSRDFNVSGSGPITIAGMTLTGGHAPDGTPMGTPSSSGSPGGAIVNAGTLTLDHVVIAGNTAGAGAIPSPALTGPGGAGGGVENAGGTLTVAASTIASNTSGDGAPSNPSSTVGGGDGGEGGGIDASGGTTTITGTTIVANKTGTGGMGGSGAGIMATAGGAGGSGAGLAASSGTVTVTNSTIEGNSAGSGATGGTSPGGAFLNGGSGGNGGSGAGIADNGATMTVTNATVAGNVAGAGGAGGVPASGGTTGPNGSAGTGAGEDQSSGTLTLQNTLLASNAPGGNCGGTATGGTHDLSFGDFSCPGFAAGDPKLGPLADNGGPTQTMALGSGSAAIDQVPATGANCPPTDQRGVKRPQGPACDIGAYEAGSAVLQATPTALSFGAVTLPGAATQTVTLSNSAGASPARIQSVSVVGADSADFSITANTCGSQVQVFASCTITVKFRPRRLGALVGTLTVASDASGSPLRVPLSGRARKPSLSGVKATSNGVSFKFHCAAPGGSKCSLSATLVAAGGVGSSRTGHKKHGATVGSVSASVPGGTTRKVTVHLNGRGRNLLKSSGKLRVKLTAQLRVSGKRITIKTKKLTIKRRR